METITPKFFISRIFKKWGSPIHLIWFITARCNLRCSHCFYHYQILNNTDELSSDEIYRTIANFRSLLSISLTGGEPFLRKDLLEIIKLLSRRRITNNLTLFSNGFDTDNILATTEKILYSCPGINISMGISIDGYENEHDKYRNKKGAYQRAADTVKGLQKLKNDFSNLRVGIGITMHNGNQHIIKELRNRLYSELGIRPGITLIRGDVKSPDLKNVDADIYRETVKEIESDRLNFKNKNIFQALIAAREVLGQRLAYQTHISNSRSYACYAGSLMGIIYENGDVYPCEMLKDSKLGNLRDYDYDINKLWQAARADETRRWIKTRKCFCTYECQYTCNTLYNIRYWPFFIKCISRYMLLKIMRSQHN